MSHSPSLHPFLAIVVPSLHSLKTIVVYTPFLDDWHHCSHVPSLDTCRPCALTPLLTLLTIIIPAPSCHLLTIVALASSLDNFHPYSPIVLAFGNLPRFLIIIFVFMRVPSIILLLIDLLFFPPLVHDYKCNI